MGYTFDIELMLIFLSIAMVSRLGGKIFLVLGDTY